MGVEDLYTIRQVADLLKPSRWTVRQWTADGDLKAVRLWERYWRVPASALASLISEDRHST